MFFYLASKTLVMPKEVVEFIMFIASFIFCWKQPAIRLFTYSSINRIQTPFSKVWGKHIYWHPECMKPQKS